MKDLKLIAVVLIIALLTSSQITTQELPHSETQTKDAGQQLKDIVTRVEILEKETLKKDVTVELLEKILSRLETLEQATLILFEQNKKNDLALSNRLFAIEQRLDRKEMQHTERHQALVIGLASVKADVKQLAVIKRELNIIRLHLQSIQKGENKEGGW